MSARDIILKLARETPGSEGRKYHFGMEVGPKVAAALRELADQVEVGELIYQNATLAVELKAEDFVIEKFTLEFSPCTIEPGKKAELYKSLYDGRQLPVAVAKVVA